MRSQFVDRMAEWQAAAAITQRDLAARIGVTEGRVSQLFNQPNERPSGDLMSRAIAAAPEPWKSALRLARQADQEAADAVAAARVA